MKILNFIITQLNNFDRFFMISNFFYYLGLLNCFAIIAFFTLALLGQIDINNLTFLHLLGLIITVVIALIIHVINLINYILKAIYSKLLTLNI